MPTRRSFLTAIAALLPAWLLPKSIKAAIDPPVEPTMSMSNPTWKTCYRMTGSRRIYDAVFPCGEMSGPVIEKENDDGTIDISCYDEHVTAFKAFAARDWISVKERLPDPLPKDWNGTAVSAAVIINTQGDGCDEVTFGWYCHSTNDWLGRNVTHWMPLPEAPKTS